MWAARPIFHPHHDHDDMPMDLRKKDVLRRTVHEDLLDLSRKRSPPPAPESPPRGTLENAIRRLHQNSQLKKEPKEERCRSTDTVLGSKDPSSLEKRSNSCPDLTVILPTQPPPPPPPHKPSPIKPKSSFIQRSISSSTTNQPPVIGGARKRKSFVPAYGEQRTPLSPVERWQPSPVERWQPSPVDRMPPSPVERHSPYDEYYSHPEVLLRRQLQETPPYLLHVYDYYQQLVQRLRENSHHHLPPVSPTSVEDEGGRKRPCRALTGKHVRQGTGASVSTLLTLRQKIQERQKAREHTAFSGICGGNNRNGGFRKAKPQQMKAKENALKAYC